jgi:hypothetical protein
LAAHLEEMGFPMEVITTRWFMCAYTTTVPKEVTFPSPPFLPLFPAFSLRLNRVCHLTVTDVQTDMRLWDVFLYDGSEILLLIALAIFKIFEEVSCSLGSVVHLSSAVFHFLHHSDVGIRLYETSGSVGAARCGGPHAVPGPRHLQPL